MRLKGRDPDDRIVLRNDYHNNKCVIYPYAGGLITKRQVTHAWNNLCGHYECSCTHKMGIRGDQEVEIIMNEDGSAKVLRRL